MELEEGEAGTVVARKVSGRSAVDEAYGVLDLGMSTDEFITELRGEPDAV